MEKELDRQLEATLPKLEAMFAQLSMVIMRISAKRFMRIITIVSETIFTRTVTDGWESIDTFPGVTTSEVDVDMNLSTKNVAFVKNCHVLEDELQAVFHFPSNIYFASHVTTLSLNAFLSVATIFLNGVTVITFWNSSHLRTKKCSFLILVQSVMDLAVGVLGSFTLTFMLASQITGNSSCWLPFAQKKTCILLTDFSMTVLSAMNFDRYMSIGQPLVHRVKVTRKSLVVYITCMCSSYLIMLGLSFVARRLLVFYSSATILLFLLLTTYFYTRIFLVATANGSSQASPQNNSSGDSDSPQRNRARFLKEIKLAKACFFVVVSSFVCFLPPVFIGNVKLSAIDKETFEIWGVTVAMMNPSLNSLIFFWRNRLLRQEAKTTLKNICNVRRSQH